MTGWVSKLYDFMLLYYWVASNNLISVGSSYHLDINPPAHLTALFAIYWLIITTSSLSLKILHETFEGLLIALLLKNSISPPQSAAHQGQSSKWPQAHFLF